MSSSSRVRMYMGCSFDGFIAGPEHDIDWLSESYAAEGDLEPDSDVVRFDGFMREIGAMLMGCSTYGICERFGQRHYGETPVLVATHRPLEAMAPTIQTAPGRSTISSPGPRRWRGTRTSISTAATSSARR